MNNKKEKDNLNLKSFLPNKSFISKTFFYTYPHHTTLYHRKCHGDNTDMSSCPLPTIDEGNLCDKCACRGAAQEGRLVPCLFQSLSFPRRLHIDIDIALARRRSTERPSPVPRGAPSSFAITITIAASLFCPSLPASLCRS